MNISLETYLRAQLDELERNHQYEIATDGVRAIMDYYHVLKATESTINNNTTTNTTYIPLDTVLKYELTNKNEWVIYVDDKKHKT
jgi:hypothetical protein